MSEQHETGYNYRTNSELNFLQNIGSYSKQTNRIKCLKGYIESAKNRVNWGEIDKKITIKFAKKLLKES